MYDPTSILTWLRSHVQGVRLSRLKTLSAIVSGALVMKGVGVLALGRAMAGEVSAKHCIKRVWRFLRNDGIEIEAISAGLVRALAPREGPIVLLADWTFLKSCMTLVFAVPLDGRALPVYSRTIRTGTTDKPEPGTMVDAEYEALEALRRILPEQRQIIVIADRAFGHTRWLNVLQRWGWGFVQRLARNHHVQTQQHMGFLHELGIQQGDPSKDWGWGDLGERGEVDFRLVTVWGRENAEPWYLATNLSAPPSAEIVRLYQRRMWIEAMFRDLKNRNWGLGLDNVKLSQPIRHDRHFLILAIAYAILVAFGAAAETLDIDQHFKANTRNERVMSLARIGNLFLQLYRYPIKTAWEALHALPT
jgi:hypothetical protein